MILSTIKRRLTSWIAIFAIAMGSLAPTISQAVSVINHGKGFTVEICTATGQKMVQEIELINEGDQAASSSTCQYCLVNGSFDLPIQYTAYNFKKPEVLALFPQLFYQSPKLRFVWIKLPSQAPPQFA